MRDESTPGHYRVIMGSVDELATVAESRWEECGVTAGAGRGVKFLGVENSRDALTFAREGWDEQTPEALRVAESAVATVERDHELPAFTATFDVFGSDVDVVRYLECEPECMIDYPLAPIVKAGRVITVCVAAGVSASVDKADVIRRGHGVVALVLALSQLGYSVEVWSDYSTAPSAATAKIDSGRALPPFTIRTLVKGASDALDTGRIMFALAHPAMTRALYFAASCAAPAAVRSENSVNLTYNCPVNAPEDLPEGTIYLPAMRSAHGMPDADKQLAAWLVQLGIITDETVSAS